MKWSDIGEAVGKVAPALGTALGGPMGGAVGTAISAALGVGDNPDDVAEALKVDPKAAIRLKELEVEWKKSVLALESTKIEEGSKTVRAEAQGESWLQRNWRPILMLVIVAIVANNFVLLPYLNAIFGAGTIPALDLPEALWELMKIGVGGYVLGRSAEKGIRHWKGKD